MCEGLVTKVSYGYDDRFDMEGTVRPSTVYITQSFIHVDLLNTLARPETFRIFLEDMPHIQQNLNAYYNIFSFWPLGLSQNTQFCKRRLFLGEKNQKAQEYAVVEKGQLRYFLVEAKNYWGFDNIGNETFFDGDLILKFHSKLKDSNDLIRLAKAKFRVE